MIVTSWSALESSRAAANPVTPAPITPNFTQSPHIPPLVYGRSYSMRTFRGDRVAFLVINVVSAPSASLGFFIKLLK